MTPGTHMEKQLARRPEWLKKKIVFDESRVTSTLLGELNVRTVCREAKCPNISECFKEKQATFLILGNNCTRQCRFCHVDKTPPAAPDADEPRRIALAVKRLGLDHAVITSPTRDDLPDGGAAYFAATVREIKKIDPPVTIELLIPDFQGDKQALDIVIAAEPDILGHNIETVPRLYHLRPQAKYRRSLVVLKIAKDINPNLITKSALMLGLGETEKEVVDVLKDLREVGCDFLALGQYLRPSLDHVAVEEYIPPARFDAYKNIALSLGFKHVASGPYVRSSYHAGEYLNK
jgi:lipoyl synthase